VSGECCGWCGRQVTVYIVHKIKADHGPDRIVWCQDAKDCRAARAKRPRQPTSQTPAIRH
jgi:hypothetical protein